MPLPRGIMNNRTSLGEDKKQKTGQQQKKKLVHILFIKKVETDCKHPKAQLFSTV